MKKKRGTRIQARSITEIELLKYHSDTRKNLQKLTMNAKKMGGWTYFSIF